MPCSASWLRPTALRASARFFAVGFFRLFPACETGGQVDERRPIGGRVIARYAFHISLNSTIQE